MTGNAQFVQMSVAICWWGGVVLVAIGVLKMGFYAVGVTWPDALNRIHSETLRQFFTGKGNRLVFGIGGLITAAVGGFFMLASRGMAMLLEMTRL
ncbi:MAG: hypothetical protein KDN20_11155 [Verrucomicrobiae bacterium]|nr:hypothetical protein [Verrucomicrobiae bacterium]